MGKVFYLEAANGMMVRVPEEKYASWKKAQDEIRAGKRGADPQIERSLRAQLQRSRKP